VVTAKIIYFPVKAKPTALASLTLDQRLVLAAKRPSNPLKRIEALMLAMVRLHGGVAEIASSTLDLGNQRALAVSVVRVIQECVEQLEKL
jgi:hypothetical protein